MSIKTTIELRTTHPEVILEAVLAGLSYEQMGTRIGVEEVKLFKGHFQALNGERHQHGTRGFYERAGAATKFDLTAEGVEIAVTAPMGSQVAQRRFGGTLKPQHGAKYLTLPAIDEAYGKRAREFDGLVPMIRWRNGERRAIALVAGDKGASLPKGTKKDNKSLAAGPIGPKQQGYAQVIFWLVKELTQKPDPSVLPTEQQIEATAMKALNDHCNYLASKQAAGREVAGA